MRDNIVLGGAGLVGAALCQHLREQGERVVVYDLKDGYDLRFKAPRLDAPDDCYCWFLAWDVGGAKYITAEEEQAGILRSNLLLCDRVFEWLRTNGIPFTFVSTQMVGYPNAYGLSKQIGEYWCDLAPNGLIARLWNCYDAEEVNLRSHLIPDLVKQGVRNGRIKLMTSGEERRQFLHAEDCAQGLIAQREIKQPVADLTSGQWIRVRNVAEAVADQIACPLEPGTQPGYESMIEPTHRLPNWQPKISLEKGIEMVIDKMRKNGWV